MFRKNSIDNQQMTFNSAFYWMSDEHRKMLSESWAGTFRKNVLSKIDEAPYAVLYSSEYSRPNAPVNVLIGMMILEAVMGIPESVMRQETIFNAQVQYALGLEDMKNVDISERTMQRFRNACIAYEAQTGTDLIHNTIVSLAASQAEVMGLTGEKYRMDSLMVDSYIRTMSRLELVFQVNQNLLFSIVGISKNAARKTYKQNGSTDSFIEKAKGLNLDPKLFHYLNPYDKNLIIYHNTGERHITKKEMVLADAMLLHVYCENNPQYKIKEEYSLFERVINEQCKLSWLPDENGIACIKVYEFREAGEGMDSNICQNPADPDSTYRKKAGAEYRGYVANVAEQSDDNSKSLILEYDYDTNNTSDNELGTRTINRLGRQEGDTPRQMSADGSFVGEDIEKAAANNKFELVNTALKGNEVPDYMGDHKLSDDEETLDKCAGGQHPTESYVDGKGTVHATINPDICVNCPHNKDCSFKKKGDATEVKISRRAIKRALKQRMRKPGILSELTNFRNGVETIPSVLRRRFHIDTMPVRGLARTKLRFGIIIGALNFVKCRKALEMPRVECA